MDDDLPSASPPEERPSIRLDNVLKLAGIADTGGQAKRMIQAGEVRVNGAVETRRKHRLHEGDEVEVDGETFVVELTSEDEVEDDMNDLDDLNDDGLGGAADATGAAAATGGGTARGSAAAGHIAPGHDAAGDETTGGPANDPEDGTERTGP